MKIPAGLRVDLVQTLLFEYSGVVEHIFIGFAALCELPAARVSFRINEVKELKNILTLYDTEQDERIEKQIAGKFPALDAYRPSSRAPSDKHLDNYGGIVVQDKFQLGQRASLKFALHTLTQNDTTKDINDEFRELLVGIGQRRMHTACVCQTSDWRRFGDFATEKSLVKMDAPMWNKYVSIDREVNQIVIEGVPYTLTSINKARGEIEYQYLDFWKPGDPVFRYAANIYKQLKENKALDVSQRRVLISKLHWILCNVLPWDGGTAANAETLADALWIMADYVPPNQKTLDLFALGSPSEKYSGTYPRGTKHKI